MWKLEFRRSTLIWLLAISLLFGIGANLARWIRGKDIAYPVLVTESDAEARSWKRKADSVFAVNEAAKNAPIRINTATVAEFESLDGIGKILAARIVAYRQENGPFSSVDELQNVSGIGTEKTGGDASPLRGGFL